ncbi:hypothetical protein GLW08_05870 [Pontibacillus yanchengensis]|uniref:Uncharacterized protein n=2 Tax=Pontibacillus yanchengensis TaxID=462910 RepID=A0ACC7VDL5_9BACI|nr:hypothetical protein [Pontibacillus yanchengensis]MYL32283.1 hypothetical protein [Pontibacillus yanchengensis]MYL52863.1 hypothetical protein [Pontibacillus yanchengensis]
MDTKKLHFLIAFISYTITILHFILVDYTNEKLLSGITFYSIATVLYVGFVYLFFKTDINKKLVIWGLLFIGIISIILALVAA